MAVQYMPGGERRLVRRDKAVARTSASCRWGAILAISFLAGATTGHAQDMETALEMQSWCKPFATAQLKQGGYFAMPPGNESQVCWGAFAAIQQLSSIVYNDGKAMLGICARASSTRIQFIQIFLQYANQHPEQADMDFAGVARRALSEKFPCQ
jgi:hypothetical protein